MSGDPPELAGAILERIVRVLRSHRVLDFAFTGIAETKAELLRWMFIFWVGQVGVMTGILFAFFPR